MLEERILIYINKYIYIYIHTDLHMIEYNGEFPIYIYIYVIKYIYINMCVIRL